MDKHLKRDLKTLARFIEVYCRHQHRQRDKTQVGFKPHDVTALMGRPIHLCDECRKLLGHALVKRSRCPMATKPACKRCPNHCHHPTYRRQIREVMKYSGRRLILSGRLDYLFHLLF